MNDKLLKLLQDFRTNVSNDSNFDEYAIREEDFQELITDLVKLFSMHFVVGQSVQFICPKCKSNWGVINAVCFECEHEKDISK
jgi:hypothetical protein